MLETMLKKMNKCSCLFVPLFIHSVFTEINTILCTAHAEN